MDVQALGSAVIVAPQADPAQSQNQTNNPSQDTSGVAGVSSSAASSTSSAPSSKPVSSAAKAQASPSSDTVKHVAPVKASASTEESAAQSLSPKINVSYRFVQNPVQVVVVFTDAADGQQVSQVPPEFMVKLVQLDHGKGELVDRDA